MITTEQLESMGWVHKATAKNGGSKQFQKGNFAIFSHADNFIKDVSKKSEITLSGIVSTTEKTSYGTPKHKIVELFVGNIDTIDELIEVLVKYNADIELCRDHKINQIVDGSV